MMRSPPAPARAAETSKSRLFWPLVGLLLLIVPALHVSSLRQPHFEGDEVVFTFMAERVRQDPLHYSLRGPLTGDAARRFIRDTWLPLELFQASLTDAPAGVSQSITEWYRSLSQAEVLYDPPTPFASAREYAYDPTVYDRPMFFHPPVYPGALAGFRAALGPVGGPLLSLLCHAGLVVLVAILGRMLGGSWIGVVAAALVVIEPVSMMAGSRLWTDGPLQMLAAATMLAVCWALRNGGVSRAAVAGGVLAIACLTKAPAVLLAPAILAAAVVTPRWPRIGEVIAFIGTAAALIVPWLVLTKVYYGAWLPAAYPTQWLIDRYEYVRVIVNRPWHFYVSGLLLTAPILLFVAVAPFRVLRDRWLAVPLVWAVVIIGVLWGLGLRGQGMQLRYLAPAMPALCLLAAAGIVALVRRSTALTVVTLSVAAALGAVTGINAVWSPWQPPAAEPVPIVFAWVFERVGMDFFDLLPGMWR